MTEERPDRTATYRCAECGLHYETRDLAKRCEAWCREHKSCNFEIIRDAIENRARPH